MTAVKEKTLTVWSEEAVMSVPPSSLIRMLRMLSAWPTNLVMFLPDFGSHNRITLSGPPLARMEPFVQRAYIEPLVMPSSTLPTLISTIWPAPLRSQRHILWSRPPEATQLALVLGEARHLT